MMLLFLIGPVVTVWLYSPQHDVAILRGPVVILWLYSPGHDVSIFNRPCCDIMAVQSLA